MELYSNNTQADPRIGREYAATLLNSPSTLTVSFTSAYGFVLYLSAIKNANNDAAPHPKTAVSYLLLINITGTVIKASIVKRVTVLYAAINLVFLFTM